MAEIHFKIKGRNERVKINCENPAGKAAVSGRISMLAAWRNLRANGSTAQVGLLKTKKTTNTVRFY